MSKRKTAPIPTPTHSQGSDNPASDKSAAANASRHAASRAATAEPGSGGSRASSDWFAERITPAAGVDAGEAAKPVGVPVDTSPTDNRKGRANESKRGAY